MEINPPLARLDSFCGLIKVAEPTSTRRQPERNPVTCKRNLASLLHPSIFFDTFTTEPFASLPSGSWPSTRARATAFCFNSFVSRSDWSPMASKRASERASMISLAFEVNAKSLTFVAFRRANCFKLGPSTSGWRRLLHELFCLSNVRIGLVAIGVMFGVLILSSCQAHCSHALATSAPLCSSSNRPDIRRRLACSAS